MKALVALLLLLNIGFAAWQLTRQEAVVARRQPADVGIEPLRLLAEVAKPLPVEQPATSPAPKPPPVAPELALP